MKRFKFEVGQEVHIIPLKVDGIIIHRQKRNAHLVYFVEHKNKQGEVYKNYFDQSKLEKIKS